MTHISEGQLSRNSRASALRVGRGGSGVRWWEVGKVCGGREQFVGEPGKASNVWGTIVTLVQVVPLAGGEASHGAGCGQLTRVSNPD